MALPLTRMVLPTRRWRALPTVALLMAFSAAGCGHGIYAVQSSAAANKLEEAHELGAEKLAPYEYYYARELLEKAEEEAAEASYGDAEALAEQSEEYAAKAIALSRDAHRGAGR